MGILETLRGKLGVQHTSFEDGLRAAKKKSDRELLQKQNREVLAAQKAQLQEEQQERLLRERNAAVDRLGQQAIEVFTPALQTINTLYGNGRGKILDLSTDYEAGIVQLGLEWDTDKVEFLATPKEFDGEKFVDSPIAIKPVARVTWKRLGFCLRSNGSAEFVTGKGKSVRFNIGDKDWEKKISSQAHRLIAESGACDDIRNEYYEDYRNRKRVEKGEQPIDYEEGRKLLEEFRRLGEEKLKPPRRRPFLPGAWDSDGGY